MRLATYALAGLLASTTLVGCGASAGIPDPPSTAQPGPPPGSSPEMARATKAAGGGHMGSTRPPGQ